MTTMMENVAHAIAKHMNDDTDVHAVARDAIKAMLFSVSPDLSEENARLRAALEQIAKLHARREVTSSRIARGALEGK